MAHRRCCQSDERQSLTAYASRSLPVLSDCSVCKSALQNRQCKTAMPRHLEQVLAHAENQLAATGAKRPTEVLPLYKKFLKIEEHRLRLKHQAGGGGREISASRSELVDVLLQYVFGAAVTSTSGEKGSGIPLTLIALGG